MTNFFAILESIGRLSVYYVLIPLALWTLLTALLFLVSRGIAANNPTIHYQSCMALLVSLPLGFLVMPIVFQGVNSAGITLAISPFFDAFVEFAPASTGSSLSVGEQEVFQSPAYSVDEAISVSAIIGALSLLAALLSFYSVINFAYKVIRLRLLTANLRPLKKRETVETACNLKGKLGIKRSIILMQSPTGTIPFTYGWRRPVVVMPEDGISEPPVLRATLLHELIHVRRNDYLAGLIVRFLAALFVFHPLVLLLGQHIKVYQELSCDRETIGRGVIKRGEYARLLLRFNVPLQYPFAVSMIRSMPILKKRIKFMERYTEYNPKHNRLIQTLLLPASVLLPMFVMSCSLHQTESGKGQDLAVQSIAVEDLSVSLRLPEEWVEYQEPIRKTRADRISQLSESELKTVDSTHPEKIEHGANFYTYNNLDQYGSIPEEDLFGYFLTIEMHDYFDEERRTLWGRGECGQGQPCSNSFNPNLNLIRELNGDENPFGSGIGFLYALESDEEDALPRQVYTYYVVEGEKCYRVILYGFTRDLQGGAHYDIISAIDFNA